MEKRRLAKKQKKANWIVLNCVYYQRFNIWNKFYIWSKAHRAWWKDNRQGYTNDLVQAGIYELDEAIEICQEAKEPMVPV